MVNLVETHVTHELLLFTQWLLTFHLELRPLGQNFVSALRVEQVSE